MNKEKKKKSDDEWDNTQPDTDYDKKDYDGPIETG